MKSKREQFLEAEEARMRQRAFEERERVVYKQFVARELEENARNRIDPRWKRAWDRFHEHWQKAAQVKEHVSPFFKRKHRVK